MKKGQAAIEYLISYGWTILVILITVGVIVYFDILSPIKFIPEQCEFGEQIECLDMQLYSDGSFKLLFMNSFPKPIVITDMVSENYNIIPVQDILIEPSETEVMEGTVEILDPEGGTSRPAEFAEDEKQQIRLKIVFRRATEAEPPIINPPPTPLHEVRGVFVTGAETPP